MAYHGAKFLGESRLVHGGAALPSMWAAMAINAVTVSTPVPPTPVTTVFQVAAGQAGWFRQGSNRVSISATFTLVFFQAAAQHRDETGDKNPLTAGNPCYRRSADLAFEPQRVSLGSTDRQLDLMLQSPQPSHTSSLINRRRAGSSAEPFFRRRRNQPRRSAGRRSPRYPQYSRSSFAGRPVHPGGAGCSPARWQTGPASGLDVADQGDTAHTLTAQLVDQVLHFQGAVYGLATGHGHRVVVENLVGDIDPAATAANGQDTRMEIGAVPRFWNTCSVSVKGACPIQVAPSRPSG